MRNRVPPTELPEDLKFSFDFHNLEDTYNFIHHLVDQRGEVLDDLDVLGIQVVRPRQPVGEGAVVEVHAAYVLVLLLRDGGRVDRGGE